MHIVEAKKITEEVRKMAIEAAYYLPDDVLKSLKFSREAEKWTLARDTLDQIIENAEIAKNTASPMCQDTGMAVLFVKIGQDVHIEGGYIEDAINEGVRQAYSDGYLRKSVVKDPVYNRVNTKDNTPAVVHYEIVPGDKLHIMFAAKGFGSENMSRLAMLKPSDGIEGVKKFILETVELAGPNPCPPIVVGVGIGGTVDKVTLIAKKALMRPFDVYNSDPFYADLEKEMLEKINALGIGPQGYGGKTTALRVMIETFPTHIAGLPVCVNINCHATRHKEVEL
ncbi:fumarate hydratase [Treponema pedis]|uniref:Fumarate hydratase n=5 Tax=Treponema pedis TaxID=409322 RepID=S6A161_9SPIR|nr:fumarate hydratase [Treponema pedis]AGT44518.1 fumarate hydratase [Treponema pedis str. T A4]QOW59835.1 fumarate hydratase [Treponema pedis]QSI05195.1 fumarate hydratase [Treponema pedis]